MSGKYEWQPGASPPTIDPHSLAKHEVLRGYLRRYMQVVTADRRMEVLKMTMVDGFAGGGEYSGPEAVVPGSPLIMLDAMADAAVALAAQKRGKPLHLDIQYVFVEKDVTTTRYLVDALARRGHARRIGHDIDVVQGTFEDKVDDIIAQIKRRGRVGRSIFVLDQYGYTDVLLATIRKIFKLQKAEVLLTLPTDWLVDFIAPTSAFRKAAAPLELDPARLLSAKTDNRDWRRAIQHLLYEHIVQSSGAAYYTPFFIVSPNAHRSFWLLHLSSHAKARDEMAKLHWELHNHFEHYGRAGLRMLGYNPEFDPRVTGQIPFAFDQAAREATLAALKEDLPVRLAPYTDGVPFEQLFARIANETPAHSDLVKDSILDLASEGVVDLRGPRGGKLKRLDVLDDQGVVALQRQTHLFVQGRKPK